MNSKKSLSNKWLIVIAALLLLAPTLSNLNITEIKTLRLQDFLPIVLITIVIFLFKTSIFSALLIAAKKLVTKENKKS